MEEKDFEGTEVLERLAEIGKLDRFFEAVDADNFGLVKMLMKQAGLDAATIQFVMQKMSDSDEP